MIAVVAAYAVTTDRYANRQQALYAHIPLTTLMIDCLVCYRIQPTALAVDVLLEPLYEASVTDSSDR